MFMLDLPQCDLPKGHCHVDLEEPGADAAFYPGGPEPPHLVIRASVKVGGNTLDLQALVWLGDPADRYSPWGTYFASYSSEHFSTRERLEQLSRRALELLLKEPVTA